MTINIGYIRKSDYYYITGYVIDYLNSKISWLKEYNKPIIPDLFNIWFNTLKIRVEYKEDNIDNWRMENIKEIQDNIKNVVENQLNEIKERLLEIVELKKCDIRIEKIKKYDMKAVGIMTCTFTKDSVKKIIEKGKEEGKILHESKRN